MMTDLKPLPFKANPQSLKIWLKSLEHIGAHRAGLILYDVLLNVNQQALSNEIKLGLLHNLIPASLHFSEQLEKIVAAEQCFLQQTVVQKTALLSGQLLYTLSLNYGHLCTATDLDRDQLARSIFTALHLIGLSHYKLACLNLLPAQNLWKNSAELYLLAEKHQLLKQTIPADELLNISHTHIIDIIKRDLLFTLTNPYHFNANTIKKLFRFAEQQAHFLKLTSFDHRAAFIWTLSSKKGPNLVIKSVQEQADSLYINMQALNESLNDSKCFGLNQQDLDALRLSLKGFDNILDSAITAETKTCQIILSPEQMHTAMAQQARLLNIARLSANMGQPPKPTAITNLTLLPLQSNAKSSAPSVNNPQPALDLSHISIQATSFKNYVVGTSWKNNDLQVDQIVLLLYPNQGLKLACIKQIVQHPEHNNQLFLLEYFTGSPESVCIKLANERVLGILLKTTEGEQELVVPPLKIQSGQHLTLIIQAKEYNYLLKQLLDVSPDHHHYKVTVD